MKKLLLPLLAGAAALAASAQPALTIYNQNFAVVREHVPLDLKPGLNTVTCSGVTLHLEPDSVILRDPSGRVGLRVLEQNYRADTVSQGLLLSLNEGRVLDFLTRDHDGKEFIVKGRVIRSGYVPLGGGGDPSQRFYQQQLAAQTGANQPIIEVNGQLRFSLPGEPQFPALADDTILKPLLVWQLESNQSAKFEAELSYLSEGLKWSASYNLVAPEKGDTVDLIGWVTVENQSGKAFENATVKLMAGDVNKLAPEEPGLRDASKVAFMAGLAREEAVVTEKAFDEFHLYSLARPVTLHDRETKQVEFLRATGVKAQTLYVYKGADIGPQYRNWNPEAIRNNREYGAQSNPKVWVMREFKNSEENHLGQPLPKGRVRFYRRDDADGRMEFTGENLIDHTPRNELVRLYTGDAFDLVGERRQTDYVLTNRNDSLEESFEIRLRNRKTEPVEVRVVEPLYRGVNWSIVQKSHEFTKTDARTAEFRVTVPADGETVVTYRVHYDWK